MEEESVPARHATQREWDQRHRHAWDAVGFSRVRQQHLVNLEALAREQLLRHDWAALPATLAALLSAQDPQLNDKGEAGVPSRAARNTFVLDAAWELLPHARGATAMQQQRLARLAAEQAGNATDREARRLEVAVLAAVQGDADRAYDLLSAPAVGQWEKPDRFVRACLAGQLKHAAWAQGMERAARQAHRLDAKTTLPRSLLYTHDMAVAHSLDSRTVAAAAAAEKHLAEAVALQPGAPLPTWLLFQLLAAAGRAPEAAALARAAAAAAPHDADLQALAALAAVADSVAAAGDADADGLGSQAPSQPLSQPQPSSQGFTTVGDAADQQQTASLAAGCLAVLRCDPASSDALRALHRAYCAAAPASITEDRTAAVEGAALFLDMHMPGSAAAAADDGAVIAAWQLLADTLRAEAEAMRQLADDPQPASAVWNTIAARSWWWPDTFFTPAAAEAAINEAAAAEAAAMAEAAAEAASAAADELPAGGRPQSAAAQRLAAQAVVAAFVEPPCSGTTGSRHPSSSNGGGTSGAGGGSFAAVVARLCRRQTSLAHITEQVYEAIQLTVAVADQRAAAAGCAMQPPDSDAAVPGDDAAPAPQQTPAGGTAASGADDRLPAPAAGMTGLKRSWWAAFPHKRRAAAA